MNSADADGDGQIDYNEFVAATMNISKLEKDELIQKTFMVSTSLSHMATGPSALAMFVLRQLGLNLGLDLALPSTLGGVLGGRMCIIARCSRLSK